MLIDILPEEYINPCYVVSAYVEKVEYYPTSGRQTKYVVTVKTVNYTRHIAAYDEPISASILLELLIKKLSGVNVQGEYSDMLSKGDSKHD